MRTRDRIALVALSFLSAQTWAALVDSNITGMIRTRNRPWSAKKHNAGSHNMKPQELMMASVVDDGSVGLIQDLQRRSTDTNRIEALEVALRNCNHAKVVPELYYTEDKLQELKLSKLRSIAAGHGASQEAIDEALDHDIPKTALIEVIRTRQNDAEAINDVAIVAIAQGPDAVFGPLGQDHKTAIVMAAILGLVGIATWIKCWIDRYEQQGASTSAPWWSDRNALMKIGGVAFSAWLGVGVILSSQVILFNLTTESGLPRHLTLIEAFNFAMQIVTTIGWGDMTPATEHGQAFVACYILLGVLLISTIVAEMLEMIFSFTRSLSAPVNHGRYAPVIIAGSQFLTLILLGTIFYGHYPGEEKSVYQAFYFSVVSLSTVGFGAFAPRTSGGKLFAVFWALAGVASTAQLTVAISYSVIRHRKEIDGEAVKEQLLKDLGEGGKLSMQEFLFFELVRHGFCKEHDLNQFIEEFRNFDKDGSGFLERNDFEKMLEDSPSRFLSGDLNRVPHMTPGFFSKIVSCKPRFMGGATKPI